MHDHAPVSISVFNLITTAANATTPKAPLQLNSNARQML
jgi:hypothetical protein